LFNDLLSLLVSFGSINQFIFNYSWCILNRHFCIFLSISGIFQELLSNISLLIWC
jgi:hypothetical protein